MITFHRFPRKIDPLNFARYPIYSKYVNSTVLNTPARIFNTRRMEREIGIDAVIKASKLTQKVFQKLVAAKKLEGGVVVKKDSSPVTVADYGAQAVVNYMLGKHFPNDLIVGEEDTATLRDPKEMSLRTQILDLVNSVLEEEEGVKLSEEEMLDAIDRGRFAGGPQGRFWTLDPIDGTKGFLRADQYAICLALIVDGKVQVGIMGCPNLPHRLNGDGEDKLKKGCIFVAVKGQGAFQEPMDGSTKHRIRTSDINDSSSASFCESFESAHSSHSDSAKIAGLLGMSKAPLRMDSQCKYGCIARGDADIYLRITVKPGYEENIWDHASGALLVEEAGGTVTDFYGNPLDFGCGRTLKNNVGVIATNGKFHSKVLNAATQVVGSKPKISL